MNLLEQQIPIWPPVWSGKWLERVFLSPMVRWDANWFIRILTQGYQSDDGTTAFHPLLPLLGKLPTEYGVNPALSLLIVNALAVICVLYLFRKLAQIDLNLDDATTSVVLFLFSPLAFTLFIPYTEPLYLLFAIISFINMRQSKWWFAGISGALATLTRQQGLLLLFPLAWELWESSGRNWRVAIRHWKDWFSLCLIPLGMLSWLLFRGLVLNDVHMDLKHPKDFIYSILLSPNTNKVVPQFAFLPPWQVLAQAFNKLRTAPDIDIWTDLIIGFVFLIALVLAWPHLRASYRLFSFMIILVSLSDFTGPVHPYMGLPRHLWLAFPAFIGLAPLIRKPRERLVLIFLGALGAQFLLFQYVIESWVP